MPPLAEALRHSSTRQASSQRQPKQNSFFDHVFRNQPAHVKARAKPVVQHNTRVREGDRQFRPFKKATSLLEGLNILFQREPQPSLFARLTSFANEAPFPLALPQNGIPYSVLLALPSLARDKREIPVLLRVFERHYKHVPPPVASQLFLAVLAAVVRLQDFILARKLLNWFAAEQEEHLKIWKRNAATWTGLSAIMQATPRSMRHQIRPLHQTAVHLFCQSHGLACQIDAQLRRVRRPKPETLDALVSRPDLLDVVSVQTLCELMQKWNNSLVAPRANFQPSQQTCLAFLKVFSRVGNEPSARLWLDQYLDAAGRTPPHKSEAHLLHFRSARDQHAVAAEIASSWARDPTLDHSLQLLGKVYGVIYEHNTSVQASSIAVLRLVQDMPSATRQTIEPAMWGQLLSVLMQRFNDGGCPQASLEAWNLFLGPGTSHVPTELDSSHLAALCQALLEVSGWDAAAAAVSWYGRPSPPWSNYEGNSESVLPVMWKGRPPPQCTGGPDFSLYQSIHVDTPVINILLEGLLRQRRLRDFFELCPSVTPKLESRRRPYSDCKIDDRTLQLYLDASFQAAVNSTHHHRIAKTFDQDRPEDLGILLMQHLIHRQQQQQQQTTAVDGVSSLDDMILSCTFDPSVLPDAQNVAVASLQRKHFQLYVRLLSLQGKVEDLLKAVEVWHKSLDAAQRPRRADMHMIHAALDNVGASAAQRAKVRSLSSSNLV